MTPAPYFSSNYITEVISRALESGSVYEEDYLIFDEADNSFSVGPIGVSNGHNKRGFELSHFVDFDEDCPLIDEMAIKTFSEMIADGLLDI